MRKPRDFDSELKALADKARQLKERRVRQLGELVTATGADALDADLLAGALLHIATVKDTATKEGWRSAGAAFFLGRTRQSAQRPDRRADGALPLDGGAASRRGGEGAN
ncbi:MAG: conjugal transfer protein TraD [Sphingomonas sp. 66-10]|uniref:conjugal transfer protein TraD n=1 Tax=Sphingomonas sp. 66-10 TaxID=1895848 RepID=UPI00092639C0|nr:conjugal transfer protein TraD [Sphingomonas sp. 66-10]OJU23424.1 MAG: conjugal transfer protein TraD [Sphingomonas sp. 66-10]